MADILIAYSCAQGRISYRNPRRGSWFIQAVCKIFAEHATAESLESMLVMVLLNSGAKRTKRPLVFQVNDYVAGHALAEEGYKQMPCYESHLRTKFYFIPGLHGNFTKPKGLVLIIHNYEYPSSFRPRPGTFKDEDNIRALFEGFGYDVLPTLPNLVAEVRKVWRRFGSCSLANVGCRKTICER